MAKLKFLWSDEAIAEFKRIVMSETCRKLVGYLSETLSNQLLTLRITMKTKLSPLIVCTV